MPETPTDLHRRSFLKGVVGAGAGAAALAGPFGALGAERPAVGAAHRPCRQLQGSPDPRRIPGRFSCQRSGECDPSEGHFGR